jgi:hypothetical protein
MSMRDWCLWLKDAYAVRLVLSQEFTTGKFGEEAYERKLLRILSGSKRRLRSEGKAEHE